MNKYLATKKKDYVLEPLFDKIGATWQSHHVTNPAAFRPSFDDRVYLGYRAGGDRDHYCIDNIDVWSSSLGLAILDDRGEKVLYRFKYPIMKLLRKVPLPQSPDEYPGFVEKHGDSLCVMHDFRLYEHNDFIYCIFHDGFITKAFDCVKRMKSADFKRKVLESIALMEENPADLRDVWAMKWWGDDVWENAGVDGTRLIYPSDNNKNDIIFYKLKNGNLLVNHRPLPDIANTSLDYDIAVKKTVDGFADMGTLETCTRPGFFDNSHVGANGMPTLADINGVKVYIDVCHGVNNRTLAADVEFRWDMIYLPYFRIRDYESGELLYYSDAPILEVDEIWREYTENGRWMKLMSHLHIVFVGGQVETVKGRGGVDDEFSFYSGIGDTAISRATFRLRDIVPPGVIEDISDRAAKKQHAVDLNESAARFPTPLSGWRWELCNNAEHRCVSVKRYLDAHDVGGAITEIDQAERLISCRPGYFDADVMQFDGKSLFFDKELGWLISYKGIRWTREQGFLKSEVGFGILVLDKDNPEKILYRSLESIVPSAVMDGWTDGAGINQFELDGGSIVGFIPSNVRFEIKRANEMVASGKHWTSHHTLWLQKRAEKCGAL
ncbi:MAG: glycoside hydrolase family protein [Saccharofermentanales bacterium]